MIYEQACCCDEAANHQLPIAAAFWIIQIVSKEECSSLTQNLMQIRCSTHSVILNAMATQHTCSLSSIYHPHWLVHWSCHCSHTHSSPLSLPARLHWCHANHSHYIKSGWTFSGQALYSQKGVYTLEMKDLDFMFSFLLKTFFTHPCWIFLKIS